MLRLKPIEGDAKLRAVGRLDRIRIRGALSALRVAMDLVHVLDDLLRPGRTAPGVAAVAHDGEQPRPRIATMKAAIVAPGAQVRLLDDVLRVVLVAHEIARERVRVVERGHDDALE